MDQLEEFFCTKCGNKCDYSEYGTSDSFDNPICQSCYEKEQEKQVIY